MRKLSETEVLSLREILQMETNGIEVAKAVQNIVKDGELKDQVKSSITTAEGRIRGIQQFISENDILEPGEVH